LGEELVPGLAGGIDDSLVGVEDTIGEPVLAQILPDVLDRVQLRGSRGQEDERHVLGDDEVAGGVPAGAVEQQSGIKAAIRTVVDTARLTGTGTFGTILKTVGA